MNVITSRIYLCILYKNIYFKGLCLNWQKVNQLASSLYASGTNLSRSVSSVGEHQSETYVSPTLPKRAETFGGFDNANKDPGALNKGMYCKDVIISYIKYASCNLLVLMLHYGLRCC
jgi:hypothetical protein